MCVHVRGVCLWGSSVRVNVHLCMCAHGGAERVGMFMWYVCTPCGVGTTPMCVHICAQPQLHPSPPRELQTWVSPPGPHPADCVLLPCPGKGGAGGTRVPEAPVGTGGGVLAHRRSPLNRAPPQLPTRKLESELGPRCLVRSEQVMTPTVPFDPGAIHHQLPGADTGGGGRDTGGWIGLHARLRFPTRKDSRVHPGCVHVHTGPNVARRGADEEGARC